MKKILLLQHKQSNYTGSRGQAAGRRTSEIYSKYTLTIRLLLSISILISCLFANIASAADLDYSNFKTLPILDNGRIKPLDTYARITLKSLSNKETYNNQPAINWLINTLFNPKDSYNNKIFYVHNPDLKKVLNLENTNNYYSFKEVLPGIKKNIAIISSLEKKNNEKQILAPAEKQLLDLYHHTLTYFDLSRSMSLLLPEFEYKDVKNNINPNLAYQNNSRISYYQVLPYQEKLTKLVNNILAKPGLIPNQDKIINIATNYKELTSDKINISLKIIPNNLDNDWLAPWQVINTGNGSPTTAKYLNLWQDVIYNYHNITQVHPEKNTQILNWKTITQELNKFSISNIQHFYNTPDNLSSKLYLETVYTKYNFFNKSVLFYILALCASLVLLFRPDARILSKIARPVNITLFSLATSCHLIGLALRVYILGRPPVSNLYESILFVGLITATLSLVVEIFRKDNISILLGSLICTILQFIANSYVQSGDSLGVLIAVLNNNFWLGTHVIAITSGYSCCLLLSALSHVYLLKSCLADNSTEKNHHNLYKYILALGLLSLFLTMLGTILGGIWADQSWGRFWGWDPKENGALLICLWLITIIHGRISGQLDQLKFAAGAALTSIMVALAWFGVNVLGTGLHSYGFTENIALNLFLFIAFELVCVLGLSFIAIYHKKLTSRKHVKQANNSNSNTYILGCVDNSPP